MTGFLYDDEDGVRHNVDLNYYDTPLGVRRDLSGGWRFDPPTAPPPPPPPPPPTPTLTPLIGFYPSTRITDAGVRSTFGQDPQLYSSYWQPGNYKSLVSVEGDRMDRGCHIVNLLASVKDWTGNATQSRDTVNGLINGNPPNILVDYLTLSEQVAKAHPNLTYSVCMMGEVEVGVNQAVGNPAGSTLASLFAYYNNDITAIFTALGRATNAFFTLADEIAPSCDRSFWMGGSQSSGAAGSNNTNRNTFYSQITNPPSYVPDDPYNNTKNLNERFVDTAGGGLNKYLSSTGVHRSHYVRWGKPPVACNETGSSHLNPKTGAVVYTDAEQVPWLSSIYDGAAALPSADGPVMLRHVIYFNSAGNNGTQFITGGSFDQSVAAFAGEITQAKLAAAA